MAHLACTAHKRRVVYLIDNNDRVIVRHRNGDGSPCSSTNFTSRGCFLQASDFFVLNYMNQKEN